MVSIPDDLELLVGEARQEGEVLYSPVSKFRQFATDGRVCLSLEQTGTSMLIVTAWLSGPVLVVPEHDPGHEVGDGGVVVGPVLVVPEYNPGPFPIGHVSFREEFLGNGTRDCTHSQIKRISFPWREPQIVEPLAVYDVDGDGMIRVQVVTKDYSVCMTLPPEIVLDARRQAEQMAEVVRDSAERCSCLNEYDTTKKEMTWTSLWSKEDYYIFADGDILLAIDSAIDKSVIVSAVRPIYDGMACTYRIGRTSVTATQAVNMATQLSWELQESRKGAS